jgi:predicted methyltransferase
MDRDEVYEEMIRVLRSNGYNDLVLAVRDGKDGCFVHYIPFTDVSFNGKNVMKVVTTTGKLVSVRFSDVVKIESITSIQEGDIHV